MALVALGRLQARRGDPQSTATLDNALNLALGGNTLQRLAPVRAARAEAAYLRGDLPAVIDEARRGLSPAAARHPWFAGELAYWLYQAGALESIPALCAEPFALQLAGRWREAATAWEKTGCPYEQARALADGGMEAQFEALALFEKLGAGPALEALRGKLRTAGRSVPRGARASTQANPHALTDRELEVLMLLCEGLKNSEIAERLCRSVRTVDHHLAAAFAKLGVSSRTEAVAATLRAGLRPQNGQRWASI
jgi:DNA-binding CsgD family transcriptional regulator